MPPRNVRPTENDLLEELGRAIERNELRLEYQPIVRLGSAAVIGAEALVRWRHPKRGTLAPIDFLPAAERAGLIGPIGDYVLQQAAQAAAGWPRPADRPSYVSVNVVPLQLSDPAVAEGVLRRAADAGLDPGLLVLELTSSVTGDHQAVAATLTELRTAGVRVALDDFGSATSLLDLKRLPVDIIKLDREFVIDVEGAPRDAAFILVLLNLAEARDVEVIAKGVESREQAWRLAELGCRYGQGFFFSKPIGASGMVSVLRQGSLRG